MEHNFQIGYQTDHKVWHSKRECTIIRESPSGTPNREVEPAVAMTECSAR
jgi:hypothetical protein